MVTSLLKYVTAVLILLVTMVACTSSNTGAPQAVAAYLQALTVKDQDALLASSCPAWEMDALMELDALNLVQTTLKDIDCEVVSSEGDISLVTCQGIIEATYGSEVQTLDISQRTFQVDKSSGDWLVCGYK